MNFNQFQIASMRTMPFGGKDFNPVEFHNILSNYALGIMGEYFELQTELDKIGYIEKPSMELVHAVQKEFGDLSHYLVGMLTILEEKFDCSKLEEIVSGDLIMGDLSNVAETVKKHVFHGHELNKELIISSVYRIISHFNTNFGTMVGETLIKNIEKLRIRYPEVFSVEDSIARKDVQG